MKRPLPRRHHAPLRLCSIAVGVAAWGGYAAPALAVCPGENLAFFCSPALIGDGPRLTQADIDNPDDSLATTVWVLDGTTTLRLPAGGDYTPAAPVGLAAATIFVTENASLIIEDAGATGVDLDANIVLCDSATLEIRDSELRFGSTNAVTFALDDSQVLLAGATISGPGSGATQQVFGDTATLTATPTAFPSVRSGAGSINWAFGDTTTATIVGAELFASLQVGASASASISDSSYIEMLMESCEGDTLAIDGLPVACDVDADCFSATHPHTTFSRPEPFAMQVTNTQVYGWRMVSHPGSATTIEDVSTLANLAMDLTGDFGVSTLTFPPGQPVEGLNDRTVAVSDSEVLAWAVSANGTSDLTIDAGSELGALTCSGDAVCSVFETTFPENAPVRNLGSATMNIHASTLAGPLLNAGAGLEVIDSALTDNLTLSAPTWLAESSYVTVSPNDDGVFHVVELDTPVDGTTVEAGAEVEIQGSLYAEGVAGTARPFPTAVVELHSIADEESTVVATLEATAANALLYTWDTAAAAPGDYDVSLRFELSEVAIARRRVTVTSAPEETSSGGGSGASTGSTSNVDSDATSGTDGGDTSSTGGADDTGAADSTSGTSSEPPMSASTSTTDSPPDPTQPPSSETGNDTDNTDDMAAAGGCTTHPGAPPSLAWVLLGLCLARRRREDVRIGR